MRMLVARVGLCLTLLPGAALAGASDQANRPSLSRTADEWVTTQIQAQYSAIRSSRLSQSA